ncbi:MAG TPA: 3-oxoacyl-[acyl-carrier-protein] synthase III C-terminal domain-containing protein, partial [Candidatus Woesebacteria bacterium]|nr:3-oxoacyl-[acyl-carrier-protein] synthase III C-terminal domain-containing protein [Candidatus Woesebacteria bacterium]
WRRAKADYPSHAGRFTGGPAYFTHIVNSTKLLLEKQNMKPSDFNYAVFHMPNGSFPLKVGKMLGFTTEQIEPSYVVPQLGNSYSASALMGLVSTLEQAKPGDLLYFASYGSGAGSDAFIFKATEQIIEIQKSFKKQIKNKTYINYAKYLHIMNSITM